MPVIDGFETTKMIRLWEQTSQIQSIPIIAVTAHSGPETLSECLASGMQDMISKPFKLEKLQRILDKCGVPIPQIED